MLGLGCGYLDIEVRCTKGYYVRALARDIGGAMQCPAHLGSLRRVRNGGFGIESAVPWPLTAPLELMSMVDAVGLAVQTLELTELGLKRARCGQTLGLDDFVQRPSRVERESISAWIYRNQLVALGRFRDNSTLCVARGFRAVQEMS